MISNTVTAVEVHQLITEIDSIVDAKNIQGEGANNSTEIH